VVAIQNYTISDLNSVIEIHSANKKASNLEAFLLLREGKSNYAAKPLSNSKTSIYQIENTRTDARKNIRCANFCLIRLEPYLYTPQLMTSGSIRLVNVVFGSIAFVTGLGHL
jgi:hypothetical protein